MAVSIRCCFDTASLAFAQPILLKFLFQNENIKIISKIVNLKKKTTTTTTTILIYIMVM